MEPLDRPLGRGINVQIEVVDMQSTVAALSACGLRPLRGVKETWCAVSGESEEGQRGFLVQDPMAA
ncbi:MAG: hypothetical protein LW854_09525 [Rubrivivax sp.]|nr:hypothetical protein [Rubrivivax sp.]